MARTLEGQRVLVVGASAGIGREFARQAVQDGARVLFAARRLDRLTELAQEAGSGTPVVADITDPSSIPQELQSIVPQLPNVPVQPLLQSRSAEYAMFNDFRDYPSVLETFHYQDSAEVIVSLYDKIIRPCDDWLALRRPS